MQLTQYSAIQKTANYWENRQKWVSFEKPLQYIIKYLDSTDFTKYIIPKSSPAHRKKNLDFFCICSEVTAQTRLRMPIKLWPLTSSHLTRRKKCDDFWLPSTESFPTIYKMNDLAAIIFSRCYTYMYISPNNSLTFSRNWGMQGGKTKFHKFYGLILPHFCI